MTTRWPGQHLHRRGGGAAQQSVPRSRLGRRGSLDHSSPATNDPFSPQAGRGGRSASRDARQAQEHPGPRPTGVYSQQRLFGVQTLRIPAPGGCGRAGRGRVSENLGEGGGPGQARPQGLRPGFTLPAWALQDPSCPASNAGPPAPHPGLGGGGRSFTPCPFIRSRRPDSRPRRTAGNAHAPGPPRTHLPALTPGSPSTQLSHAAHTDGATGKPSRARTGST